MAAKPLELFSQHVIPACASLAILLALCLFPFAARAQNVDDAATIRNVEAYLNGITTLQAHFAQMNSDASVYSGTFWLWRPGRLRFQYDAPNKDYIVADGLLVHYWDDGVKNYSNAPIGSTLADFLLRKKIVLSGDLKVTSVRRPAAGKLVVTLVEKDNPEAGDLRLLFAENPMQLEKWRVTDATGQITEVTLTHIQTGIKLDPTLFRFKPPKGYDQEWKNRT
jgi:outer membrane lipoprotein-sorting protein